MAKTIVAFDIGIEIEEPIEINFQGVDLLIESGGPEFYHTVSAITDDPDSAQVVIKEFLSFLSWVINRPIEEGDCVVFGSNGGAYRHPRKFKRILGFDIGRDLERVSIDFDDGKKWILSLYREAISTESAFYRMLAYYKILEFIIGSDAKIIKWINNKLPDLVLTKQIVEEIKNNEPRANIGLRIVNLRNSVAHALGSHEKINFDTYKKFPQLHKINQILSELATILIKEKLG